MNNVVLSDKVKKALNNQLPILALESSILSQGMPYPNSLEFAKKAESLCLEAKVVPATIAILKGVIHVGLEENQLREICEKETIKKISLRELGVAVSKKWDGSTTVSSTIQIAHGCGIKVFATGGIGGVHKTPPDYYDISQDILALSNKPIIVITAGPKAILDIEKTIEALETASVTLLGYKTKEVPSFYSIKSNCFDLHQVDSAREISEIYTKNIEVGLSSSTLVCNPIPKKHEIPANEIKEIIELACTTAKNRNVFGKRLTPFLLNEIVKKTRGKSLSANIELALNNISLGIDILSYLK
jgi:pseudouridine-5'-phosphate glycosidase